MQVLVIVQVQRAQGPHQRVLDVQRVALQRGIAPLERGVGVARLALHLRASDGPRLHGSHVPAAEQAAVRNWRRSLSHDGRASSLSCMASGSASMGSGRPTLFSG